MILEGDVDEVVRAMKAKRRLIESGAPHEGPRILLFGGGGVIYGCEAGGAATAFYETGYGGVFDWIVALSTSAPGAAYLMCGQPRLGTTLYSEECCTSAFFSPLRFWKPVDTDYINEVFQGQTGKGIRAADVLSHRSKLLIGITNAQTGKQTFVTPRTKEQLFQAIHASVSIPGVSGKGVTINDRQYVDGAATNPMPVKQLIKQLKPTHVIVIPNRTPGISSAPPLVEQVLYKTVYRGRVSSIVCALTLQRRARLVESLRWLREDSNIPAVIAWSSGTVSKFERDPKKIKYAAGVAELRWRQLLE